MAVLPIRCSLKLHTNNNLVSSRVCSFATATGTTNTKDLHHERLMANNKPFYNTVSPGFSYLRKMPNDLVADRVLIKEYSNEKNGKREKVKTEEEAQDQKEVASIINKLTTVVERMREREIQKFLSRVNGEVTYEDSVVLAEDTSREIVDKFLNKPIQYLLRDEDEHDLKQKLKDLNFLIEILENSCPANQR